MAKPSGSPLTHAGPTPAAGKNLLLAAGAMAATSAMLYWGTGLHPMWWLTMFAPLPLLLISSRVGGWRAFALAAVGWFVGSLNMWHYLLSTIEIPLPVVLAISAVPACLFGLGVLLYRRFVRRGALWKAALAFPAFWVTVEYLNNVTSRHGTFANLGYTQMDNLILLQVASLTGIWGISFCLFLLPATVAAVQSGRWRSLERKLLAIAVVVFLFAVGGYGSWRLNAAPAPERTIKAGLMASGVDSTFPQDDGAALELLRDYSGKAAKLGAQGIQVIVLPEKIAVVSDQATSQVDTLYAAASARAGANVVVGVDRGTATKRFNEARMYSPRGNLAAVYDKQHMVPRFEDVDQPGTGITVLEQPSGVWGIEICKDMDFPGLSRKYGAKGVGLLLVPAWDFTLDAWLHGRMAVMRGVESGFTIVRAAKQGLLTVSDDRGRILAQEDAATVPFASLVANAPVQHDDTLYVRWGDWFAWLNIAGLVGLLLSGGRKRGSA